MFVFIIERLICNGGDIVGNFFVDDVVVSGYDVFKVFGIMSVGVYSEKNKEYFGYVVEDFCVVVENIKVNF